MIVHADHPFLAACPHFSASYAAAAAGGGERRVLLALRFCQGTPPKELSPIEKRKVGRSPGCDLHLLVDRRDRSPPYPSPRRRSSRWR